MGICQEPHRLASGMGGYSAMAYVYAWVD